MYRFLFTPRWLAFHLVVVLGIVAMVNLGLWQLRRLDARKDFNAQVTTQHELPPVSLTELLAEPGFTPQSAAWRRVVVSGTWRDDQFVLFNRSQEGMAGDDIISVLDAADGMVVVVNRGFVPLDREAVPPPPAGDVEVLGTVRASEVRRTGGLTDSSDGAPLTEIRRIDLDLLEDELGDDIAPVYLDLVDSDPAPAASDPEPVAFPALDEGPHLSYAVQWFIFSICVAIGWVLAVRRSIKRHRIDAAKSASVGADHDGAALEPAADGPPSAAG